MATSKPTLVILGGGWHKPISYSKLISAFKAAGYEVHAPPFPSMNEARPPNADITTDTALVRGYVESLIDTGRTVVALMHSYGGQVGTNSLYGLGTEARKKQGRPGGVSHLIYMCAFALEEGGSMIGVVRKFDHEHLMPIAFNFAEDQSCVCFDPKTILIGSGEGATETEIDTYLASLVRWNGECMYQNITNCAWKDIPASYIYTRDDMTVPNPYQKWMVENMQEKAVWAQGREIETVELATGHSPNLTNTQEVVDFVNHVVAEKTE